MFIRAAFATSSGTKVDRHFGATSRFDIYEVDTEVHKITFVATREVDKACLNHEHHDERMNRVVETINDSHVVYAEAIGPGAYSVLEKNMIQAVEAEENIPELLNRLLNEEEDINQVKLLINRTRHSSNDKAYSSYCNLQTKHPCMSGEANVRRGRIHLPVSPSCNIQCKFCSRRLDKTEIKPGLTSLIIKPDEAIDAIKKAKELCPEITVAGIAGPGDTLATPFALDTFEKVKENFPDMVCCLSTNGFCLPKQIDRITELGLETITVTVNAVDPEIEAKINDFVIDENGVKHEGVEGAELLIKNQLEGIRKAADRGIVVKVNCVMCPGINDEHIPEVARTVAELGAQLLNIIPLIPQNEMADVPAPNCDDLERVRTEAGRYIKVFRHCMHCRADSVGIPGTGKDIHSEIYKSEVAETFSHG